jgi:hypothetical protein
MEIESAKEQRSWHSPQQVPRMLKSIYLPDDQKRVRKSLPAAVKLIQKFSPSLQTPPVRVRLTPTSRLPSGVRLVAFHKLLAQHLASFLSDISVIQRQAVKLGPPAPDCPRPRACGLPTACHFTLPPALTSLGIHLVIFMEKVWILWASESVLQKFW